jgi:hypothetical protein
MNGNMINIGIVFTREGDWNDNTVIDEINVDILPRAGVQGDESTLSWWMGDPNRKAEYERILRDGLALPEAMTKVNAVIVDVLKKTGARRITWVARPSAYDWMFFKCYWAMFQSTNPPEGVVDIGFSATCLSSIREVWKLFSGLKREAVDEYFKRWTDGLVMTHNGLDDARYQARIFHGIMAELESYAAAKK